jgi:ubiquinone biosynthesis protein UbiJ
MSAWAARSDPVILQALAKVQAQTPIWMRERLHDRILWVVNRLLSPNQEARQRLARQSGRVVHWRWEDLNFSWRANASGLLEAVALDGSMPEAASPDLTITIQESGPFSFIQRWLGGQMPAIHIQGNVQLAAEINWLFEYVRWDIEEDLSRLVGDAPAHTLLACVKRVSQPVKQALERYRHRKTQGSQSDGDPTPPMSES